MKLVKGSEFEKYLVVHEKRNGLFICIFFGTVLLFVFFWFFSSYRAQLSCSYQHGFHPFLRYAPYKEETVYLKPRIVIYHEVLTDGEIETIKAMATPRVSYPT